MSNQRVMGIIVFVVLFALVAIGCQVMKPI